MHIEFLLEEPSAEAALGNLLPHILPPRTTYNAHVFQGKQDLLGKIPARLKAYSHWLPPDWRIAVLLDEDRQDCRLLKRQLETAAREAHLVTKTMARGSRSFRVLNRLAVEELEAWFFGDIEALAKAYPRFPRNLAAKSKFRNPDAIVGGTWEALERTLRNAGYYSAGLPKVEAARKISGFMDPRRNRSRSFQVFREGLLALIQ